ncbi:MAG: HAD family hydrolase [Butyricicoccaceae bacterium]
MAFPGNQYKLLALDLDGTLLNEKNQVSPRDAQEVRRAQERGVRIVTLHRQKCARGACVQRPAARAARLARHLERCGCTAAADAEPQFFSGLSLTHCEDILALCEEFETDPACIPRSRCTTAAHSVRFCAIWSRADRSS